MSVEKFYWKPSILQKQSQFIHTLHEFICGLILRIFLAFSWSIQWKRGVNSYFKNCCKYLKKQSSSDNKWTWIVFLLWNGYNFNFEYGFVNWFLNVWVLEEVKFGHWCGNKIWNSKVLSILSINERINRKSNMDWFWKISIYFISFLIYKTILLC